MGKKQKFFIDLKEAMKQKDSTKVLVLRSLVAGLKNAEIEKSGELTQEEEDKVIKKEAKKRQDAIEMYKKGSRPELVEKETVELGIIQKYLPKGLSEDEVKKIVTKMKEAGEIDGDFGTSMRAVMAKIQGKADGRIVSQLVKEVL